MLRIPREVGVSLIFSPIPWPALRWLGPMFPPRISLPPPLTPHFTGKSARALATEDANSVNGTFSQPCTITSASFAALLLQSPPPPQVWSWEQAGSTFPGAVRSGLLGDRDNAGEGVVSSGRVPLSRSLYQQSPSSLPPLPPPPREPERWEAAFTTTHSPRCRARGLAQGTRTHIHPDGSHVHRL